MMEKELGRPKDRRTKVEEAIYDFLEDLQISYERVDHEAAATMEDCLKVDAVLQTKLCKNLFLKTRNGGAYYLLMLPSETHFQTKELSKMIGSSRLSFGSEEEMESFLSCRSGSLGLLSLLFDKEQKVQLIIEKRILESEKIGCHPGINTSSLALKTKDVTEKIIPKLERRPLYVTLTD